EHLGDDGSIVTKITDTFEVSDGAPFSIRRAGPTRIYPVADYPMKITVTARDAFRGTVIERLPPDFKLGEPPDATITNEDDGSLELSWHVNLDAGESQTLSYVFDAPDVSPAMYYLTPLSFIKDGLVARSASTTDAAVDYREFRSWQIASDAT